MTEVWPMSPPSEVAADPFYNHVKLRFESGMEIDRAVNTCDEALEQPGDSSSSSRSESGEDSDQELVRPVHTSIGFSLVR
jgi:hypothetical protein